MGISVEYDEMVQRIIQEVTGSGSCVKAITSVISTVRSLLQTNEGVTNITKTFGYTWFFRSIFLEVTKFFAACVIL